MKFQKSVFLLPIILFVAFFEVTPTPSFFTQKKCEPTIRLNKLMKSNLELQGNQIALIKDINKKYLESRQIIIEDDNRIGKNTALLACWDQWRNTLNQKLTGAQMEQFMTWQSNADLLSYVEY